MTVTNDFLVAAYNRSMALVIGESTVSIDGENHE